MIGRNVFFKLLSVVAFLSFVSVGVAHAVGEEVPVEEPVAEEPAQPAATSDCPVVDLVGVNVGNKWVAINASGTSVNNGLNMSLYDGIEGQTNVFAVDFGDQGYVSGTAQCGDGDADVQCSCAVTGYSDAAGNPVKSVLVSAVNVDTFDTAGNCNDSCAQTCAAKIAAGDSLFDAAFAGANCDVSQNSGGSNSGNSGSGIVVSGNDTGGGFNGIKVATKKYNDTRFAYVERDLELAVDKIKGVVSTAVSNTAKIATVASDKQTRPADDYSDPTNTLNCPVGKKCLLVTAPDQTPHWYEIIDCGEDSVLGNMTYVDVNMSGFGPGEPWGFKTSSGESNLMCLSNVFDCQNGEWMTPYDATQGTSGDEIVFGTMRRVSINERTRGGVLSLPNNVQSGNVCVCKATRYKLWDSSTSSYGADHTINTDKWFVAGVADTDNGCLSSCGRDDGNNVTKEAYLAQIANACTGSARTASMCTYNPWFASIARGTNLNAIIGYNGNNGDQNTGICANPSGSDATWCASSSAANSTVETSWCNDAGTWCTPNSWIVNYGLNSSASGGASDPKLYGRAFCTNMNTTNVAAGTLLTGSEIGTKSLGGDESHGGTACVCQLQKYKNATDTNMTDIQNPKYLYSGHTDPKCFETCQYWCANYFASNSANAVIADLAGTCPLN